MRSFGVVTRYCIKLITQIVGNKVILTQIEQNLYCQKLGCFNKARVHFFQEYFGNVNLQFFHLLLQLFMFVMIIFSMLFIIFTKSKSIG